MHSIHRSIDYHRVEHDREHHPEQNLEIAFADAWEEENVPQPGINQGHGVLQNLMFGRPDFIGSQQARLIITRRDAAVAATAIQWLGTNCGRSFLEDAVKRAGYRLLAPHEREYEQQLARQERWLGDRERALREKEQALKEKEEDMFSQREARLQERAADIDRREARLNTRTLDLAKKMEEFNERCANWIALMMAANWQAFRRNEFVPGLRRLINLGGE